MEDVTVLPQNATIYNHPDVKVGAERVCLSGIVSDKSVLNINIHSITINKLTYVFKITDTRMHI